MNSMVQGIAISKLAALPALTPALRLQRDDNTWLPVGGLDFDVCAPPRG